MERENSKAINYVINQIEKGGIVSRLFMILFIIGIMCYFVFRVVAYFFSAFVWMLTAIIELCLTPVYVFTWLLFGKFPMFEMHEFVLKKLNIYDMCYKSRN